MGPRRPPRMPGLNVTHHTLAKIKRIGLRHRKSPPTGSESHSHPRSNPHRFNLTVRYSRLINGLRQKPEKNFSSRFCRRERSVETAAHDLGMAKGRIAHAASLTKFLIFCKRLSPGPFRLDASLQSNSL